MLSNASTMPKQAKTSGKNGAVKLVAGNSNQPLAQAIGAHLQVPLAKASVVIAKITGVSKAGLVIVPTGTILKLASTPPNTTR